jgi:hypothetical protein
MKEKKGNPQITQISQIFSALSVDFDAQFKSIISTRFKPGEN